MHASSIRAALASAFQISLRPAPTLRVRNAAQTLRTRIVPQTSLPQLQSSHAAFSTSPSLPAQKKGKKGKGTRADRRITLIRHFLHHPSTLTPRPLRLSRNRALRHWTIRRAWSRFTSLRRQSQQLELERQYNAMVAANEELRVGVGDGGRLFRKAMMKTGTWSIPERGEGCGVPIEYSRGLVEWVGSTGGLGGESRAKVWDEGWKRWS